MTISYQGTADTLTVFVNGQSHILRAGTVQFNQVREAILGNRLADVPSLLAPGGAIQKYLGDQYSVDGEKILFRGTEVPELLTQRIFAMAGEGLDPTPLLRFFERLDQNPSFRARNELYNFVQHLDIAITPEGMILGYKKVNDNYTDCHSGKFSNVPGSVHEMERNQVNDDKDQTCSYGFHVGSLEYARDNFHAGYGNIMICLVDPKDVVSIPSDYSGQKMRTCRYEVVGEWNGQDQLSMVDEPDLEEYDVSLHDLIDQDEDPDYEDDEPEGLFDDEEIDGDPTLDTSPGTTFEKVASVGLESLRTTKQLMEQSMDDLRKYASGVLKIVGASKISGGKAALVSKIIRVRRNRGL